MTCTSASFSDVQIFVEGMCTYYFLTLLKLLKKIGQKLLVSQDKNLSLMKGG